ncbi:hypothetical protein Tco_0045887 [Tanacetum coccineum]
MKYLRDMYHLDLSVLWFLEIPVAPIPPAPSTETATTSLACDILTLVINTSLAVRIHMRMTTRKSTLGLQPVMTPAGSAALYRAHRSARSSESSSSSTSSEDHSYHSSEAARSSSGPLTHKRLQCSDYATPTSSSSAGPSRKRSRSSATSVSSTFHTVGALSSARPDLLPPHKRYRDIRADIKAKNVAAVATVDRLGIKLVITVVKIGFKPGLVVFEFESEPEEAEADDKADAEIQREGTVKIGVDVTIGIDIPNNLLMLDAIEQLEKLEEGVQDQQARNLIVDDERSSLLERVAALECSNMKLQYALGVESYGNFISFKSHHVLQFVTRVMTVTRFGMTLEAIEELISQCVAEALATQEANRNARLVAESQS